MTMCPVCGYRFLPDDVFDHGICPSCGTEFGYDDVTLTHEALRLEWLAKGGEWFDKSIHSPSGWDPVATVVATFYKPRLASSSNPVRTEFRVDEGMTDVETKVLPIAS